MINNKDIFLQLHHKNCCEVKMISDVHVPSLSSSSALFKVSLLFHVGAQVSAPAIFPTVHAGNGAALVLLLDGLLLKQSCCND